MTTKCAKWLKICIPFGRMKNRQNGHKNTNIFHCKTFPNLPKLGFFGLKIYHLAAQQ
jgi:hypothetical protein